MASTSDSAAAEKSSRYWFYSKKFMTEQHELFLDKSVSLLNTGFSHHLKKPGISGKMGIFFRVVENYWNLKFFLDNSGNENDCIPKLFYKILISLKYFILYCKIQGKILVYFYQMKFSCPNVIRIFIWQVFRPLHVIRGHIPFGAG